MSNFSQQSIDQIPNSDVDDDENFETDDLITFQHDLKTITLFYSQLTKYSRHIRESYLFSDVVNRLPQEIHKYQEDFQLLPESIDSFFQLLQQNYNINEDSTLTYIQCIDLLKISKLLEVRKLKSKINKYIRDHNSDVDFIVQMIQYEMKIQQEKTNDQFKIKEEIENVLSSQINECFSNEKFKELPVQIIYRIVSKSSPKQINNNKLFDIIMKSINLYCVLFQFLDLQKISEDRLEDLCEMYSKSDENTRKLFNYLKCDLNFIKEMNKNKKSLQKTNEEQQNKVDELETKISQLQIQLNDSKDLNNKQQNKVDELEIKMKLIQEQLLNQLNDSKDLNSKQQNKISELENQVTQLQNISKRFNDYFLFKSQIVASVVNGLLINAEIDLHVKLDTEKSKCIISTSDAKSIGIEAYEKGEPITSLHMKIPFFCKPGTYYVRCIVFYDNGEWIEFVSNAVTTSGNSATFRYEGKPTKITLCQGKYKFEVWGAKGGDSTGKADSIDKNSNPVKGGLGGYSRGIISLDKNETVFIYVGGEGCPSNASDGLCTKGGFPDGGGTRTGHCRTSYTVVPGTGGGSTSIRIGSDTNYNRVIVAGGGGGASGCYNNFDPGGYGGGVTGGNCTYCSSLQNQGAGTQIGSTRGLGEYEECRHGDPGQFGLGATGKYRQGCDSGGGGGGGWYGGGSGGFGKSNYCSSGGGGSGWTFTESSHREWQSGDSTNASKFALNSGYYLTDVKCIGGNEEFPSPEGNGTEKGRNGNGYAKITIE